MAYLTSNRVIINKVISTISSLLVASCLLLSACSPFVVTKTQRDTIDNTINNVIDNNRVLVLITEPEHAQVEMISSFSGNYHQVDYPVALSVRHTLNQLSREYQLQEIDGWSIHALGIYCALLSLPPDRPREQLIEQLQQDSRVESAQGLFHYTVLENQPLQHHAVQNHALQNHAIQNQRRRYNDPYFAVQYRENVEQIHTLHRWATGENVTVAVIDTGVDKDHPELTERIIGWRNFVDNNEQQFNTDIHGTAMSGIIAAAADNGEGIVGIAPEVNLWALKACWQLHRDASAALCNSFTVASALSFAIEQQLDIINISLAGPHDPLVARLIEVAIADGRIIIAADPMLGDQRYPALLSGVIAVRQPATAANPLAINNATVTAAGTDVLSTGPGGGYDFFSGSSVSTAMVSGYAALLHQKNPQLSHQQRLQLLTNVRIFNGVKPPVNKALSLRIKPTKTDL